MQLLIRTYPERPLTLPINYNHILQGIIYHAIEDSEYASFIHEDGYFCDEGRSYKLFQFSQLNGKYRVREKRITFEGMVWFEIRSVYPEFLLRIKRYIDENGITFQNVYCRDVETCMMDDTVEADEIIITMKTPLTVHETDYVTKKTYYFRPDEIRFRELIQENFMRKYEAYTGVLPDEAIAIKAASFDESDKCVTKYKGFYICGWKGRYILSGQRKYLDFLYQVGLGSRNSLGFGMFDVEYLE